MVGKQMLQKVVRVRTERDVVELCSMTMDDYFFFPLAQQPNAGQNRLSLEVSGSHNDITQSVGLL